MCFKKGKEKTAEQLALLKWKTEVTEWKNRKERARYVDEVVSSCTVCTYIAEVHSYLDR